MREGLLYLFIFTSTFAVSDLVIDQAKGKEGLFRADTGEKNLHVNVEGAVGRPGLIDRNKNRPVQSKDPKYAEKKRKDDEHRVIGRPRVVHVDTPSDLRYGDDAEVGEQSTKRSKIPRQKSKVVGATTIHKNQNKLSDARNNNPPNVNKSFNRVGGQITEPNNHNFQDAKESVMINGQNKGTVYTQPVVKFLKRNPDNGNPADSAYPHAALRADQAPDNVPVAKYQKEKGRPIYDQNRQETQLDRNQQQPQQEPEGQEYDRQQALQRDRQRQEQERQQQERQQQERQRLTQDRQSQNQDQQRLQQDRHREGQRMDDEQRRLKNDGQQQNNKRQQDPQADRQADRQRQEQSQRDQEEYQKQVRQRKEEQAAWQKQRQEEYNNAQQQQEHGQEEQIGANQSQNGQQQGAKDDNSKGHNNGGRQASTTVAQKPMEDNQKNPPQNDGGQNENGFHRVSQDNHRTDFNGRLTDQASFGRAQVRWDGDDFALFFGDNVYMEQKIRRASVPTAGQPWPMPQYYKVRYTRVFRIRENFSFDIVEKTCDIIEEAIKRYRKYILEYSLEDMHDNLEYAAGADFEPEHLKYRDVPFTNATDLEVMKVRIRTQCPRYPSEEMDESYTLVVKRSKIYIAANEVWGALRALETFSQLIFKGTNDKLYIREVLVNDYPRFTHRGVHIDTSRHFVFKEVLYDVLEGMAQNKMNVLHWHIVDDQSFPYESKAFPELSKKGAFHSKMVYTQDDISDVIEYARLRGIRVMPEFDTPGHTYSWGLGYPDLLTQCYTGSTPVNGFLGPLNPASNFTYDFLKTFFREVLNVFKEKYVHLGGDEVPLSCWISNPTILAFSEKIGGYGDTRKLMEYYETKLLKIIESLAQKRRTGIRTVVWQDVLDTIDQLPERVIVHVWRGGMPDVQRAASLGHHVIYSTCWYLDLIEYGSRWYKYYLCDPAEQSSGSIDERMVLGGEAALWAEYIDNENLMTTLWPRASATAERLWSNKDQRDVQDAGRRLIEHRCRMLGRGLAVSQISGPDYCPSRGPRKIISASQLIEDRDQAARQEEKPAKQVNIDASKFEMEQINLRIGGGAASALKVQQCGSWAAGTSVIPQGNGWLILLLTLLIVVAILFHLRHNGSGHATHRILRNKTILFSFVTLLVIYITCYTTIWLQVLDVKSSFLRVQDSPITGSNPNNIANS